MKATVLAAGIAALLIAGCGGEDQQSGTSGEQAAPAQSASREAPPAAAESAPAPAPVEPMPAAEAPASQAPAAEEMPKTAAAAAAGADPAHGKQVYEGTCVACHAAGVAGAPKLEDKAAWEPRIAQGMDVLVQHAIQGFQGKTGVMPPKGGAMHLSDQDITDAVAYMVEQAR